jgi:hypothetical protein
MSHPTVPDKRFEFNDNKLRVIIQYDAGFGFRKFLSSSLNNNLDISLSHLFSNLKMDDIARFPFD